MWFSSTKTLTAMLLLSAQITLAVSGTPTPTATATCPSTSTGASACSSDSSTGPNVFGVSPSSASGASRTMAPPTFELRGGALHEPETVEDVNAIVLRAATEDKLVVIDFTASWCGPCKMIAPVFKEMSEEIADVIFVKVDVDENPDTAAKYSVSAMPTFVFVKGGEVVDRLMGANAAKLRDMIEEWV